MTKRLDGEAVSSSSQPEIMAIMLQQRDASADLRVRAYPLESPPVAPGDAIVVTRRWHHYLLTWGPPDAGGTPATPGRASMPRSSQASR